MPALSLPHDLNNVSFSLPLVLCFSFLCENLILSLTQNNSCFGIWFFFLPRQLLIIVERISFLQILGLQIENKLKLKNILSSNSWPPLSKQLKVETVFFLFWNKTKYCRDDFPLFEWPLCLCENNLLLLISYSVSLSAYFKDCVNWFACRWCLHVIARCQNRLVDWLVGWLTVRN